MKQEDVFHIAVKLNKELARAKALVNSVLDYFSRCGQYAEMTRQRDLRFHFEDCWTLVFRIFYGQFQMPRQIREPLPVMPAVVVPVGERPQWFIDKFSRPMRKVLRTVGGVDYLSCNHKLAAHWGLEKPSQHRRCPKCSPLKKPAQAATKQQSKSARNERVSNG